MNIVPLFVLSQICNYLNLKKRIDELKLFESESFCYQKKKKNGKVEPSTKIAI